MTGMRSATSPVEDVMQQALEMIREQGLELEPEARDALADLIDRGFRELIGSRQIDLQDDAGRRAVEKARSNLDSFVRTWIREARQRDDVMLTMRTFLATQSKMCPVWPF